MTQAPLTFHVHARATADGEASVEAGGTRVPLDVRWDTPPAGVPGPAHLLAGAFAACLLKNLARTRALTGFEYDAADVVVDLTRQEQPPRFVTLRYTMRVVTDEPERRLELLHANLRKFGTVYNTVAAACDVQGTVEAVPRS
ncbi:MAG TPA: OsmC family protein [Nocardioidaceae bacterium]